MPSSRTRVRDKAVAKLGGRCSNKDCRWLNLDGTLGCTDTDLLHIDHVNSGGNEERRLISDHALYRTVLNDTDSKYQLLCSNCNWKKRILGGEIKGRPHTEDAKLRISAALKGRIRTSEHRANISAAGKGKHRQPCSEAAKVKISARHKGRIITPEWRAKISATKRAIWAARTSC